MPFGLPTRPNRLRRLSTSLVAALVVAASLAAPTAAAEGSLVDGRVTPVQGTTSTIFTFDVTYANPDGQPAEVDVHLPGGWRPMVPGGTTWKAGVVFRWSSTLPAGRHPVRFSARHLDGSVIQIDGPTVRVQPAAAPTPSPTVAPTPSPIPTVAPNPTPIATPAPTATPRPTASPTPAPTMSPTPTQAPSATPTRSASAPPAATPTGSPTSSFAAPGIGGASPSATPRGSGLPTSSPRSTPGGSATPAPNGSATPGGGSWTAPGSTPGGLGAPGESPDTDPTPGASSQASPTASDGPAATDDVATGIATTGDGPAGGPQPYGSWGELTRAVEALGLNQPTSLDIKLFPALVSSAGGMTMLMSFMFFGKRRRDGEPTAPDAVLAAEAALGGTPPANAALAIPPLDPDLAMPRWRRPSLLEARKSDPRIEAAAIEPMRFSEDAAPRTEALERRLIRYHVVELLDAPDELRSSSIGSLTHGDQVELLDRAGSYWRVRCPDEREGWIHRMTLGDVVAPEPSPDSPDAAPEGRSNALASREVEEGELFAAFAAAARRTA